MEVRFIKSCATVDNAYKKGGVYKLPAKDAKQFIKDGFAEAVGKKATRKPKKEAE